MCDISPLTYAVTSPTCCWRFFFAQIWWRTAKTETQTNGSHIDPFMLRVCDTAYFGFNPIPSSYRVSIADTDTIFLTYKNSLCNVMKKKALFLLAGEKNNSIHFISQWSMIATVVSRTCVSLTAALGGATESSDGMTTEWSRKGGERRRSQVGNVRCEQNGVCTDSSILGGGYWTSCRNWN